MYYLLNPLSGNMSTRTDAAIVLSSPMTETQAEAACAAINEQLWYPVNSTGAFLKYLAYENMTGPYWIAGRQGPSCKDFTANGVQGLDSCPNQLPVLCTQSAPISTFTHADNATTWQTTVSSGLQSFTGFRDKYSFRFEGVRYAAQPERFTYSSVYNGTGHSDALAFGSECVQGNAGSEDVRILMGICFCGCLRRLLTLVVSLPEHLDAVSTSERQHSRHHQAEARHVLDPWRCFRVRYRL